MPFTPTATLAPNPDVRIFFTGLQVLESLSNNTCEVFINRRSPDHHLTIEVRRKQAGQPDVIMMRHVGPLAYTAPVPPGTPPRYGFGIRVSPNPAGIQGYNGGPTTEGKSLGLAFNMFRIHDVATGPVESMGGRPSILINEGVFYSAATFTQGATLQKKRPGSQPKPQAEFTNIIGANIYLTAGRVVTLSWRQNGRDVLLNLEKSTTHTYEIYINNDPLYEDDSPTAPFVHDEFAEYYQILPAVPQEEQFALTFPQPLDPDRGSTRAPCMSVLLND